MVRQKDPFAWVVLRVLGQLSASSRETKCRSLDSLRSLGMTAHSLRSL